MSTKIVFTGLDAVFQHRGSLPPYCEPSCWRCRLFLVGYRVLPEFWDDLHVDESITAAMQLSRAPREVGGIIMKDCGLQRPHVSDADHIVFRTVSEYLSTAASLTGLSNVLVKAIFKQLTYSSY